MRRRLRVVVIIGIDPAREKRLQPFIDAGAPVCSLHEGIEAEGGQVSFVKDDWVAQRDWPLIVRSVIDQREECGSAGAIAFVPINRVLTLKSCVSGVHDSVCREFFVEGEGAFCAAKVKSSRAEAPWSPSRFRSSRYLVAAEPERHANGTAPEVEVFEIEFNEVVIVT